MQLVVNCIKTVSVGHRVTIYKTDHGKKEHKTWALIKGTKPTRVYSF